MCPSSLRVSGNFCTAAGLVILCHWFIRLELDFKIGLCFDQKLCMLMLGVAWSEVYQLIFRMAGWAFALISWAYIIWTLTVGITWGPPLHMPSFLPSLCFPTVPFHVDIDTWCHWSLLSWSYLYSNCRWVLDNRRSTEAAETVRWTCLCWEVLSCPDCYTRASPFWKSMLKS